MSSEIGFVATEYFRSFGGRYLSHHFKRSFVSTENNRCQLSGKEGREQGAIDQNPPRELADLLKHLWQLSSN
jgi:hypothetical protein